MYREFQNLGVAKNFILSLFLGLSLCPEVLVFEKWSFVLTVLHLYYCLFPQIADQMAIAAGIPCNVDPLLYNVVKAQNHCGKGITLSSIA